MRACCSSAGLGALALCPRRSLCRGRRRRTAPTRLAGLASRTAAEHGGGRRGGAQAGGRTRVPQRCVAALHGLQRAVCVACFGVCNHQRVECARPRLQPSRSHLLEHALRLAALARFGRSIQPPAPAHALGACWWVCASARGAAAAGRARLWYGTRADAASSMCRWYTDGWLGPAPCADSCRVPASASAQQQRRQPPKLRCGAL
jgi:hypothetical protein